MKRLRRDCGGFTLVEIMVTFTLTAIFMASATLVLSTFMKSHAVASAVATEQNVASIVMETVAGALGAARYEEDIFSGSGGGFVMPSGETPFALTEDEKDKCVLLIRNTAGTANSEVWYVDAESSNVVRMYARETGEGSGKYYLALDYFIRPEAEKTSEGVAWEKLPNPWQLGEGVYQGCTIKKFEVTRMSSDSTCLTVKIILENGLAGTDNMFTLERTFDCYNLSKENIVGPNGSSEAG